MGEVFETVTEAAAGFAPPCAAVKDSDVDETERTAGAGGVTLALPHPIAVTQKTPASRIIAKCFMAQPSRVNYESAIIIKANHANNSVTVTLLQAQRNKIYLT